MPAAAALQSWSLLKYCSLGSPHGCALLLSFNLVVIVTFTCLHASMNLDLILYLFTISMPSIHYVAAEYIQGVAGVASALHTSPRDKNNYLPDFFLRFHVLFLSACRSSKMNQLKLGP